MRRCVYTGKSYTKIRETATEEDKDIIDLTEESPKFTLESTTKVLLNRGTVQCITVLGMMQQIDFKNDKETSILQEQDKKQDIELSEFIFSNVGSSNRDGQIPSKSIT